MPKKISQYDRFQALRRNPVYQEDYRKFNKWCRERGIDPKEYHDHPEAAQKAEELCKKYNIWYIFDFATKIPRHLRGDYFIKEDNAVEVIYPNKYLGLSEEEITRYGIPKYLPIPEFDEGDYLILNINLIYNKDEIVKEFIDKINYFHYFIQCGSKRLSRDRIVNKWHVFDIYNETKSFQKTLEILFSKARTEVQFLRSLGGNAEIPSPHYS